MRICLALSSLGSQWFSLKIKDFKGFLTRRDTINAVNPINLSCYTEVEKNTFNQQFFTVLNAERTRLPP